MNSIVFYCNLTKTTLLHNWLVEVPVYTCHEHQVPLQYTVIHSNMRGYVCFLHPGTTNDKYCIHFTSFNNPNEHWNFIQKKNSLIIYNYLTGWSNYHSTYWFCKVGNLISVEPICSQGLIMMMVMMTTTKKKIYIYLKWLHMVPTIGLNSAQR